MIYLIFEGSDLEVYGIKGFFAQAAKMYLEINPKNGSVEKELVLDENGQIIHKCPDDEKKYKYGIYGIFDLVNFDLQSFKSNSDRLQFYALWRKND